MSDKPNYLNTLDYSKRWGIEPMFSDFKSRGFGLAQTQIQYPGRLARLSSSWPSPSTGPCPPASPTPPKTRFPPKKTPLIPARKAAALKALLVHTRPALPVQTHDQIPATPHALARRSKLIDAQAG